MPVIILNTIIKAPVAVCFDLARSIDIHLESTRQTGETAIAGTTSGLIGLNETVTWRAKHFSVWQTLTSKVTAMKSPFFFADEMVKGAFHSFTHKHYFLEAEDGYTRMKDVFTYRSPLWLLGKLADVLFLKRYMTDLLVKRGLVIKDYAERA